MSADYDSREDNRRLLAALQHRHPSSVDPKQAQREVFLTKMSKLIAEMLKRWPEYRRADPSS